MNKHEPGDASQDQPPRSLLSKIPMNWCWATVGEVGEVKVGRQRSPKHHQGQHMRPYLRVANVYEDRIDLSGVLEMNFTPQEFEQYQLRFGDILLNEGQSLEWVGRPAMYRDELPGSCFQNTLIRFRPHECIIGKFALLVFRHYLHSQRFQKIARWTVNIAHLGAGRLAEIEFPVPPLREQERIVAKADQLLSDLDVAVAALEKVRKKLKRYRASVLKVAIDGKLTAAWRSRHPDAEPATSLLDRILKDRRRRWEEAQRARFAEAMTEPPKNWQARYQEPAGPDASMLPTLPEGWCWATVDQLAEIQGGIQKQPKRAPASNAYPFLRVANVYRGRLDLSDVHRVELFNGELEKLRLQRGDMLVVEGNGSITEIGRSAIWTGEIENCVHQNHIIRVRLLHCEPRFFDAYWNSPFGNRKVMDVAASTSGLYTLSVSKVSSLPVPLPPLDEQVEVIREVENRLSILDRLQTQVEANLKRAARLRQSILKRAFEGRLVPQVVTDEPATALLERLRRQRQEAAGPETAAEGQQPGKRRKEPSEVFFRRVAVVTYVVQRMSDDPSFGRTKLEKILHLTQTHLTYPLGLEFERYAAGPFDALIYKDEAVARKRGWFETKDRPSFGVTYHPGPNAADLCQRAIGYLGDKQAALDELLGQLRAMNTDEAELLATVYAAWNDLLIDGRPADEEAVIAEVYGWDESKRRFSRTEILARIAWMRQHGYVPAGQGQRTTVLKKKVKLPSSRK